MLTSLPLQVFIYFGGWWDALFWVLSVALFTYKGLVLPYPPGRFAAEFTFQWLWLLVEPGRLFLGAPPSPPPAAGAARRRRVNCWARPEPAPDNRTPPSPPPGPHHPDLPLPTPPPSNQQPGSKGNKTEQPGPLLFSLLLAVPMAAFLAYYVKFQTYV